MHKVFLDPGPTLQTFITAPFHYPDADLAQVFQVSKLN